MLCGVSWDIRGMQDGDRVLLGSVSELLGGLLPNVRLDVGFVLTGSRAWSGGPDRGGPRSQTLRNS